jgi:phage-related protein
MPRSFDSTFIDEKNKQENRPITLLKVHEFDGSNDLRLAAYDTNVTFNSEVYAKFPFSFDAIGENASSEISNVVIRISNVSREIGAYLEQYEWRRLKVTILTVLANQLNDPDVKRQDVYYIQNYSANDEVAEIVLTSLMNVLSLRLPGRLYMRDHCQWKFKGTECAYVGSETSCVKTLQRCRELNNQTRIGAQPTIPTSHIYL